MLKIGINNFRSFHAIAPVQIKPINILIGENSAGKTSFLSAIRYIHDLVGIDTEPSFNRDPFFLGSFDQISHFRGGRAGRAKNFSFSIQGQIPKNSRAPGLKDIKSRQKINQETEEFELKFIFSEYKSQPNLGILEFSTNELSMKIEIENKYAISINVPDFGHIKYIPKESRANIMGFPRKVFFMEYIISDILFREKPDRGLTIDGKEFNIKEFNRESFREKIDALMLKFREAVYATSARVVASAPVRSKPERVYNYLDSLQKTDGAHVPSLLAQLHAFEPARWNSLRKEINTFGVSSGLFEDLSVRRIGGKKGGPFQIVVTKNGKESNVIDVGYGISQSVPIIAEVLIQDSASFLFQQPEVHLHPRAQAALGSFFAETAKKRDHTFFIETHSDYILDRIRIEARKGIHINVDDISILYFRKNGIDTEIIPVPLDAEANVANPPEGYREFFAREAAALLGFEV